MKSVFISSAIIYDDVFNRSVKTDCTSVFIKAVSHRNAIHSNCHKQARETNMRRNALPNSNIDSEKNNAIRSANL